MIPGGRVGPQWEREIFTFSKPNRSEKLKRVWNDPQVVLTEGCSNHDTWSRAEPSNGVGFLHSNTRIKQSLMVLDTSLSYTFDDVTSEHDIFTQFPCHVAQWLYGDQN